MVLPPWWILNGVQPEGPDKDMGTWTACSFSAEQQAQFGVDEAGKVVDQGKFDSALQARSCSSAAAAEAPAAPAPVPAPGSKRYRLVPSGGGKAGLAAEDGRLVLRSPAPCQWRVYRGPEDWLRLGVSSADGGATKCLDLSNPAQEPMMAPEADVSGQYWQLSSQTGCEKLEGGSVGRGVLGYRLHAMWTGPGRVLACAGAAVQLKIPGDGEGELWEVLDEAGDMWVHGAVEEREPEMVACTFAPDEPLVLTQEAPLLCGGKSDVHSGGPEDLLNQVRQQAEDQARAQGWNGVTFNHYEPTAARSQVVAGVNHYCKVRVDEGVYAHLTIHRPLHGSPYLTDFSMPKCLDDPL